MTTAPAPAAPPAATVFYLGALEPSWLARTEAPLFISRARLGRVKRWPEPTCRFAVDSGGFSELSRHGEWTTTLEDYGAFVARVLEWTTPDFIAPQDWMCEPWLLHGRTVADHQRRTVENFCQLRARFGQVILPVLQGYGPRDYDRCVSLYADAGHDLRAEPRVGLGSICRRSGTGEANRLIRYIADHGLRLHGFGVKGATWRACQDVLASADSMAWSWSARKQGRNPNSLDEALDWRDRLLNAEGARRLPRSNGSRDHDT